MIFVKTNNLASARLRADQIAAEIGADVFLNDIPDDSSPDIAVFVKDANPELVKRAKNQGCRVIYDPIDTFAYEERIKYKPWWELVDVVIAYNPVQKMFFKRWFKDCVIIPHQWDSMLEGVDCLTDQFRPGFIGYGFNCHPEITMRVPVVNRPDEMLMEAKEFNCHVTLREKDSYQAIFKPATKVAVAAAVGAVCITTKDPSAQWLLPEEYPYWCESPQAFPNVLAKAEREFGWDTWNEAKEMMTEVRKNTSLKAVAELYRNLG